MADPIIEVFDPLADPLPGGRQPVSKSAPGDPPWLRRHEERHHGADHRPNQEAQAKAAAPAWPGLVGRFECWRGFHFSKLAARAAGFNQRC